MLHRLFSTIIAVIVCIAANAQGTCIINGTIADYRLDDGKKIKKVSLMRTDVSGKEIEVATAKVSKGKYTFKYELGKDEPSLLYTIKGFGEGRGIDLFVEPGEVIVKTPLAVQPENSVVSGTSTNDTYLEYKAMLARRQNEVGMMVAALEEVEGKQWMESREGKEAVKRIRAKEDIKTRAEVLRFFIEHNSSPFTPFEAERVLLPKLSAAYAEQMSKAMSTSLHGHPYYHSFRNRVLADNMKVGNEVPDIMLPLPDGTVGHLADFRGKYVVLNFWSADCSKSAGMFEELHRLYDVVKENDGEFVIVSFALDSDVNVWKNGIAANKADREGWVHASDCAGADSPAAKLYGVERTPKIILIEPEGRAVSLDMDIDEMVMRVEQIISGDLYYLDQEK